MMQNSLPHNHPNTYTMKNALRATIVALTLCIGMQVNAQEPAPLVAEKTQAEKDQDTLSIGILRVAEALNHTAAILTREHKTIWSLPDDRLLALLNANVQRTAAIAAAKDKAAQEINSLLNQLNLTRYTNRAPIGFGRDDVKYDEATSKFVIIPAEEPAE